MTKIELDMLMNLIEAHIDTEKDPWKTLYRKLWMEWFTKDVPPAALGIHPIQPGMP